MMCCGKRLLTLPLRLLISWWQAVLDPRARAALQLLMERGATCRVLTLSVLSESANLMATFVISFAFRIHQKDMASGAIVSATCDAMVPSLCCLLHLLSVRASGVVCESGCRTAALECLAVWPSRGQPLK